jgi:hypothetical protein
MHCINSHSVTGYALIDVTFLDIEAYFIYRSI